MKDAKTILKLMLKDHGKIINILRELTQNDTDQETKGDLLERLKWELERHFVIEEKAIFTFLDSPDGEIHNMVPKLLKDHADIKEMLRSMETHMENENEIDIAEFQHALMTHKKFEEVTFYPKLDQELDSDKKKMIIERINEQIY